MSARKYAAGGVDRWEVVRVDHDCGDISYEVYSSEPYGFLFAIYEDLNSRAKAIADGIVADHNARLSPSPRDQACSAMLAAIERVEETKSSSYKARNGRVMGIQDDSGEMCWIVDHEAIYELEEAAKLARSAGIEPGEGG